MRDAANGADPVAGDPVAGGSVAVNPVTDDALPVTAVTAVTAVSSRAAALRRVVVIGNGMAGSRIAQELADAGAGLAITVVGDEPGTAYNRTQLSAVLAGQARADSIGLASDGWLGARGVTVHAGTAAVRIDRPGRRVQLADGCSLPYDTLVLATGSSAVLPPVPGLTAGDGCLLPGAVAFRTLADCAAITGALDAARPASPGAGPDGASPDEADRHGASRDRASRDRASRDRADRELADRELAGTDGASRDRASRDRADRELAGTDRASRDRVGLDGAGGAGGVAGGLRAVVAGSGVLGLETARGLAQRGAAVTLLQRSGRLLERELDAGAARVLARTAASLGVRVHRAGLAAVLGPGRLRGVTLTDGTVLDAELLVLCCGIRPRVELARQAGLAVGAGVLVDDQLRSSDPRIYAIGECAEHRGRVYGLAAPAWEQARVAARAIAEPGAGHRYAGSMTVTRLKADGMELASLGDALAEEHDEDGDTAAHDAGGCVGHSPGATTPGAGGSAAGSSGAGGSGAGSPGAGSCGEGSAGGCAAGGCGGAEVIRLTDRARGVYQKLVVRDGRVAGAILVGDTRAAAELTQLLDRGAAAPADRLALLLGRRGQAGDGPAGGLSAAALPGRATVCRCNGVTKDAVCAAWRAGARDTGGVADRTRATTGCGTCRDLVSGIVAWLGAQEEAAAAADIEGINGIEGIERDTEGVPA